jgi:hypothetical protein
VQAPTTANLTGMWSASATDVYAVGGDTIVHSTDGATFTKFGSLAFGTVLNDVWGSSQLGVFAVGGNGPTATMSRYVLRSVDHGATWTPVTIAGFTTTTGSFLMVRSVFVSGSDVWVASDAGLIYHSSDGTNFSQQAAGVTTLGISKIRGIPGKLFALLGSDPGSLIYSTDNGVSWTGMAAGGDSDSEIAGTPNGSTIIITTAGSEGMDISTDKGMTWAPLPTGISPSSSGTGGSFLFADNNIYVATQTGIIHYGN